MSTLDMLQGYAQGGRASDFWQPEDGKTTGFRVYRHNGVGPNGEAVKELCTHRTIHFGAAPDGSKRPVDCPFVVEAEGDGCAVCRRVARAEASNDKAQREAANRMRVQTQAGFTIILVDDPTRFRYYEAGYTVAKEIFRLAAKCGGWMGGYPDAKKATKEDWEKFKAAFEAGLPRLCGPNGRDIYVTYNKGKGKDSYKVDMAEMGNSKVLPFVEDENVISVAAFRNRIEDARREE